MRRKAEPTDHVYDLIIRIRSPRPYTKAELERLASWWVFVKDRQVKVESVKVKSVKKGT